jgi:hypothetical protein
MEDNSDTVWMTYDEAGRRLGIKSDSVRRRAASRKWPKRMGNDRLARVGIPASVIPDAIPDVMDENPDESGSIKERLASAESKIQGLQARLSDTQSERDRLARLLEQSMENWTGPGLFSRIFGR